MSAPYFVLSICERSVSLIVHWSFLFIKEWTQVSHLKKDSFYLLFWFFSMHSKTCSYNKVNQSLNMCTCTINKIPIDPYRKQNYVYIVEPYSNLHNNGLNTEHFWCFYTVLWYKNTNQFFSKVLLLKMINQWRYTRSTIKYCSYIKYIWHTLYPGISEGETI